MTIDQIEIWVENGQLAENEIKYYLHKIQRHSQKKHLKRLVLHVGDGFIDLRYTFHAYPFERIRRVDIISNCIDKCS